MGNSHKEKAIQNDLTYLLCPGCFTRVPVIDLFFENFTPKIRITCKCKESQSRPSIMEVSSYIGKMRYRDPLLLKCYKHSEINYMIKLKDNRIVTSVSENNIDIWKLETINY